jgi:hypothetical protein
MLQLLLINIPYNVVAPNVFRPGATSLEDPSHSLDAPPQDDIPASVKLRTCEVGGETRLAKSTQQGRAEVSDKPQVVSRRSRRSSHSLANAAG